LLLDETRLGVAKNVSIGELGGTLSLRAIEYPIARPLTIEVET
jgi:hypothetical protein